MACEGRSIAPHSASGFQQPRPCRDGAVGFSGVTISRRSLLVRPDSRRRAKAELLVSCRCMAEATLTVVTSLNGDVQTKGVGAVLLDVSSIRWMNAVPSQAERSHDQDEGMDFQRRTLRFRYAKE